MDISKIHNVLRVGEVTALEPKTMRARVSFPGKEDLTSALLPVLTRGSHTARDYWMPNVGDMVVCCFILDRSGGGLNDGFILGSIFNEKDKPPASSETVRRLEFGDGSYIEHDRKTGALTIHATGPVTITGSKINLN